MQLLTFDTLPSTNDYIREHILEFADNTAVFADKQTNGKGRVGKKWESPNGQLCFSMLVKNGDPIGITHLFAVIVCEVLRKFCSKKVQVGIKWCNDIVIDIDGNYKKICGILCEKIGTDIIVGIGINLNVADSYFAEHGLPNAGSLHLETDKSVIRDLVIAEYEYHNKPFVDVLSRYKTLCVNVGKPVKVIYPTRIVYGNAVDITDKGELYCADENGGYFTVNSGEVSVRGITDYV
ncbi:MAG: biotin--[acetyl-CoA-carboxylase] ligase [Oscillospiraceae bacterium]|jgi:BirA family biotin operon repressor/biotin-[acetyl-CoA-carboxylase] ligase|nr:biotin--[acetyl-CoA-carboxylase] ligase [Oscillospiraceae bacterium]